MKNKYLFFLISWMVASGMIQTPAQAKVCISFDQMKSMASAVSNSGKEISSEPKTPKVRQPVQPTQREVPIQRQYVGDGIYLPNPARDEQQKAYQAARAALDQPPSPPVQPSIPQRTAPADTSSGSSASTPRVSLSTLTGMIPSAAKCRGVCF